MKLRCKAILFVSLAAAFVATMTLGETGVAVDATRISFNCPADDCHLASFFRGSGGFVGRAAHEDDPDTDDDESRVYFFMRCGDQTASTFAVPDSSGIVRQALTAENGFACGAQAGGELEIRNLDDGGWFWINDGQQSAVAPLIAKDVSESNPISPTNPGGLTFHVADGGAASFVKHEASGRIGILLHILPQPPTRDCGHVRGSGPAQQVADDCLIDAAFSLAVTRPDYLGRTVQVGSTVHRRKIGNVTLTANVHVQGHVSMSGDPEFGAIAEKPLAADWELELLGTEPGLTLAGLGIQQDGDNPNQVTIAPASYCDDEARRDYRANIRIKATRPSGGNAIAPDIPDPKGQARTIGIVCPPPAALYGRNLIPANPFPPSEDRDINQEAHRTNPGKHARRGLVPQFEAAADRPELQSQAAVTVNCAPSDDCQLIPWFRGEGGLVGTRMNADEDVNYVAECGSVTTTRTAPTDDGGIVRLLFTFDNGLACASAGGRFRIANLAPGGWYWIHDGTDSAVASLIHQDAVRASRIDPVDPGGVVMTKSANGAATFVKHEPTGRVGLLSNLELSVADTPCAGTAERACTLGSADDWTFLGPPAPIPIAPASKEIIVALIMPSGFVVRYPKAVDPDNPPTTPEELLPFITPTFTATAELTCNCHPASPLRQLITFDDATDDDNGDGLVDEEDDDGGGAAGAGLPGSAVVKASGSAHVWSVNIPPLRIPDPDNPDGPTILTEWCRETNKERFRPVEFTLAATFAKTPSPLMYPVLPKREFTTTFEIVCPAALRP